MPQTYSICADICSTQASPRVGGHEGIGIVLALGENVTTPNIEVDSRVGMGFLSQTCRTCEVSSHDYLREWVFIPSSVSEETRHTAPSRSLPVSNVMGPFNVSFPLPRASVLMSRICPFRSQLFDFHSRRLG
jgi:hypothetical protein